MQSILMDENDDSNICAYEYCEQFTVNQTNIENMIDCTMAPVGEDETKSSDMMLNSVQYNLTETLPKIYAKNVSLLQANPNNITHSILVDSTKHTCHLQDSTLNNGN
jgi:hypothetical protein